MTEFILNNVSVKTTEPTGSLLLDLIREDRELKGTKIGCREGDCGACTVLVGRPENGGLTYRNITSCLTPIGNVHGTHVVTIEGLNMDDLSPVQKYMVEEAGTQCGFCTPGFVVSMTSYCLSNEQVSLDKAIAAIDGNICRCTGYKSIERATEHIVDALQGKDGEQTISWLIDKGFIPSYFEGIYDRVIAIEAKKEISGSIVGGGTDLYVQKHMEMVQKQVQAIGLRPEMKFIQFGNGVCEIGGGVTVTELLESYEVQKRFPNLWSHVKLVSSTPIRNISTLAGNFVNASPIGDFTAFFLALNATLTLSGTSDRKVLLKDFYLGYKTLDLQEGEYISKLTFNEPLAGANFNLEKVSKRTHLDIASVNSAMQLSVANGKIEVAHLSAGGIGPIPTYLTETVNYLKGKEVSSSTIKQANEVMQKEISPISDVRGTTDYKRLLLRQLFYGHFLKMCPELKLSELV